MTPFVERFGRKPLFIEVAGGSYADKAFKDCVVFTVNKDNPLNKISFDQLDAIYSATRNRGLKEQMLTRGERGLTGEQAVVKDRIFTPLPAAMEAKQMEKLNRRDDYVVSITAATPESPAEFPLS